jgi:valyl-tRNA synthetase
MNQVMDKKYDHKILEKAAQDKWSQEKTYKPDSSKPLYNIDTPPPTVSGNLHIGHVFSYTQTDILARFQRLLGKNVFYPFGFDDNGLATERFVEKKLKIKAHAMPRSEFIAACLQETSVAAEEFKHLWRAMGLSANLDHTYSTISQNTRKISQTSFIELYQKGYIYRRNEPTLYCASCRTSVAQAELDDQEQPSKFNDIVFKTANDQQELVISTTRPELLSSCVALFYHPEDARYLHLKDQMAIVPIFGNIVPILADQSVSIDKGTGLVMCCTFGDKNDIEWYKKFKLPYRQSIGYNGKWLETTGPLANLNFKDARTTILRLLSDANLLKSQRDITHHVNIHERCKNEIEYLAIPQWYIKILDFKQELIAQANQIKWYPLFMKSRCIDWIENLSWDWGISRQRFYGIPFPVWHCNACNHVIIANKQELPIDPQETAYNGPCPKCASDQIVPETDVMDTWNTSSITPLICFDLWSDGNLSPFDAQAIKQFIPMSMRAQAHDIIRTWAFDTMVKTWMHYGTIPWQEIVISGHVLSSNSEKLSKSKDNSKTSPQMLLEQFPADAIRYWTACGNLGYDAAFSEDQIKIGCKLITKLWNAFKFIEIQISTHSAPTNKPDNLGLTNEWILTKASNCFKHYENYLSKHEFGHALNVVEKFFWSDFCDNYLELIKNLLFNPDQYRKTELDATMWTLYHTGLRILQLYAPYLPHITENIANYIYKLNCSIHITKYQDIQTNLIFNDSLELMTKIIEITAQVRKLKTEQQLSLKTELVTLTVYSANLTHAQVMTNAQLIKGITQTQEIKYFDRSGETILTSVVVDGQTQYHAQVQV